MHNCDVFFVLTAARTHSVHCGAGVHAPLIEHAGPLDRSSLVGGFPRTPV